MVSLNLSKLFSNNVLFKREFGTDIEFFRCILNFIDCRLKPKQGRKPTISNVARLLCFLSYFKRYDAMESLGLRFGISTTTVWRIIHEFKSMLMNCSLLQLDGVTESKVIMIDGTDTPVEKPKVDAVGFYGRKKCYALKTQVVIDGYSKKVLAIDTYEGSIHDFQLFISEVSKIRVLNEHVIGKLKFFKIFAGRYIHCKELVFSFWCFSCIVAGIYNLNLRFG